MLVGLSPLLALVQRETHSIYVSAVQSDGEKGERQPCRAAWHSPPLWRELMLCSNPTGATAKKSLKAELHCSFLWAVAFGLATPMHCCGMFWLVWNLLLRQHYF